MPVWGRDRGTNLPGPFYTHFKPEGHAATTVPRRHLRSFSYANQIRSHASFFEDFLGKSAIPGGVNSRTTGTPTGTSIVANGPDGLITSATAATNELEVTGIDWGDQRTIPASEPIIFQTLSSASTIAAGEDAIWGVISTYNSTLASIGTYAWFRLSGSMVLTAETNDGTTATLAQLGNPSVTLTASTYYLLTIDMEQRRGRARFFVNDSLFADLPWTALPSAAVNQLQPFIAVRKASGTDVISVTSDFWYLHWQRTNLPF